MEDSNLRLFNEELIKDGYKYQLQIKCFEYNFEKNEYFENVEKELKNGNAEVAFLGLGDEDNNIYKLTYLKFICIYFIAFHIYHLF